jgi:hypothetical protein
MAPVRIKKHGEGTTGSDGIIRPSLRDGFTAYSALSLGTGLDCPHHPRASSDRELGLSVGRPGPHAFAVRTSIVRPHANARFRFRYVHRIPRSTFVTIAKRPSLSSAGRADHASDLGSASSRFLKNEIISLRQTGTTGNLRMARVRNLPVGQPSSCAGSRAAPEPLPEHRDMHHLVVAEWRRTRDLPEQAASAAPPPAAFRASCQRVSAGPRADGVGG